MYVRLKGKSIGRAKGRMQRSEICKRTDRQRKGETEWNGGSRPRINTHTNKKQNKTEENSILERGRGIKDSKKQGSEQANKQQYKTCSYRCLRRFFLFLLLLLRFVLPVSYFSLGCRQGDGGNIGGPGKEDCILLDIIVHYSVFIK